MKRKRISGESRGFCMISILSGTPEEHCRKAPELLEEAKAEPELIHAVVSHGYGICSQVEPEHPMEKNSVRRG